MLKAWEAVQEDNGAKSFEASTHDGELPVLHNSTINDSND